MADFVFDFSQPMVLPMLSGRSSAGDKSTASDAAAAVSASLTTQGKEKKSSKKRKSKPLSGRTKRASLTTISALRELSDPRCEGEQLVSALVLENQLDAAFKLSDPTTGLGMAKSCFEPLFPNKLSQAEKTGFPLRVSCVFFSLGTMLSIFHCSKSKVQWTTHFLACLWIVMKEQLPMQKGRGSLHQRTLHSPKRFIRTFWIAVR